MGAAAGWCRKTSSFGALEAHQETPERAATSLARLLKDRGRVDEARDSLRTIYGWFAEDFDTPDLK